MSDEQVRVTFQPHGRSVYVLPGTKVLEASARAGLTIDTPCGGAGKCGKCRVQVASGVRKPAPEDQAAFSASELTAGWRLACQTPVCADCVVHVPEGSLFASQYQILAEAQARPAGEVVPAVRKVYVELPEPAIEDGSADLMRLERQVGPVRADLETLRGLPGLLRAGGFRGTAVLADHRLIDFEPGDTSAECFGVAFDVGTTTVVGSLLDLRTGGELAIASAINPQTSLGDDVLSRINHAGQRPDGLRELQDAIVHGLDRLVGQLCRQAGVKRQNVYEVAFAGNTAMEHLLCGVCPVALGQAPFVPAYARGLVLTADEIGLRLHRRAAAYVFPVIGGFVGGDIVAGMLATRLAEQEGPVLMVDIGTNGEIVLLAGGELLAASTAAGPAFEGARISCGMRATRGAIEKVVFDGDVHLGVIGNAPPAGLCGSGLIDLAAELLGCGVLGADGRLLRPDDLPADLPGALRARVLLDGRGQGEFLLAEAAGGDGPRVVLTQRDVRELQLASGAIRAGISVLLRRAGLATTDLRCILVAGGFGSFIRRSNAQRIGLLPTDVDHRRIHYVGNASLNGARWALLSAEARRKAEELARRALHVELSGDPGFQDAFAEALVFPPAGE